MLHLCTYLSELPDLSDQAGDEGAGKEDK
jgi:hypothetical protein